MMMKAVSLIFLLAVLSGCRYDNVRVHSYWGTTIDRPAAGSIYDWSAESGHLDPSQDPRLTTAVEEDVERQLAAMGFVKRAGSEQPDILISLHTGRGLQPSPSGPEQRATLTVQAFWATDGRLLYCATADALIEPTLTPEERRARLNRAIHHLLQPLAPCITR